MIRDCLLSQDRVDLSSKKAWDLAIPENYVKQWALLVKEGITQDTLTFNRSVRPASAVKATSLIGFFDGSSVAMAGAIYIRWMCFMDNSRVIEGNLSNGWL